jgi:predicted RNA-binding protein (virulence factor B family)
MRVSEILNEAPPELEQDQWVDGEAWRNDPEIGLFVILDKRAVGLVPRSEPHRLSRGEAARFRVTNVLPDGKLELSLRALAHEELEKDAEMLLARLTVPNAPRVSDRSSPEQVRAWFGLSKKAFKRAVGRLLKQGAVVLDAEGYVRPVKDHQAVGR